MKTLALTLSLAFATAALAAPALARSDEPKQVTVSTADLNLDHPAGVDALYSRIRGAAREVCRGAEGRGVAMQITWRKCMNEAVDGAVASAHNDALASLHLAKSGRSAATVAAK
ncbi:MAG TPA: UrcA family protein [Myxococcota bacterium]|nr:UrcA family protein [Myxococcota bacterium]